jgi:hypothetical protein
MGKLLINLCYLIRCASVLSFAKGWGGGKLYLRLYMFDLKHYIIDNIS